MGNPEHFSGLPIIFEHCVTQKTCTRSTGDTVLKSEKWRMENGERRIPPCNCLIMSTL